ncbi:MAG: UvrD-helicase domain-containing protein [Pseudomonadota bacterium]|nr:UvrD-helicase domain-containing protein [Pseudomonadota bacterium]
MNFLIAATFTDALAKLSAPEQKAAKTSAFDLQTNPQHPGLQMHRIDKSRDPNFWSARVGADLRLIVHKAGDSVALVYVDHHDAAYRWAERRRIEAHPTTGAIQIVEVRERVVEIAAPAQGELFAPPAQPAPRRLFAALDRAALLSVGVPEDWIGDVLAADEDGFLALASHLPAEASEALLEFAATGALKPAATPVPDAMLHPDSLRRFRIMEDIEELRAALDAPFEKWIVFLHPAQRGLVERDWTGPARVVGSAGTGKTVVALHRAVRLLTRDPKSRVLVTTFSTPLAEALADKLKLMTAERPGAFERATIASFDAAARDLVTLATGRAPYVADVKLVRQIVTGVAGRLGVSEFSPQFLVSEWEHVVDAWRLASLDDYAAVPRMGRKNRLGSRQRERLWQVFGAVIGQMKGKGLHTRASLFAQATTAYAGRAKPFDHIVVDEAQDLGVPELRFLAGIAMDRPDALFFTGDIGQRIFQQPFSWKGLGVDVRGRSATLKINYRTSHQIRLAADRLLPRSVRDVDGFEDGRDGTISVFEGPAPEVHLAADVDAERSAAAAFIFRVLADGVAPAEIAIFVRSEDELPRALAAAQVAGLSTRTASERARGDAVLVGAMHLAKGLEFRAVAVIGCDEGVIPSAARVADVADEFELDEVMATERQLLYVAITRARDRAFISGVAPGSELLEDLLGRLQNRAQPA